MSLLLVALVALDVLFGLACLSLAATHGEWDTAGRFGAWMLAALFFANAVALLA